MSITGKLVGAIIGLLLFRSPWGAIIGLILGHFYDQSVVTVRRTGGGAGVLEIGERFFTATFEVMGHVAKADGRVSEAEIAAARKVMAELRLNGVADSRGHRAFHARQERGVRSANHHAAVRRCLRRTGRTWCAYSSRCRFARRSKAWTCKGPARPRDTESGRPARRVAHRARAHGGRTASPARAVQGGCAQRQSGGSAGQAPPRSGAQLSAAYQILEVDPKATDEEVAKAYRRQLSKHHPDKLKANGLPESMLEHAKQRTQQIIEAYELIKSARGA